MELADIWFFVWEHCYQSPPHRLNKSHQLFTKSNTAASSVQKSSLQMPLNNLENGIIIVGTISIHLYTKSSSQSIQFALQLKVKPPNSHFPKENMNQTTTATL